LHPAIDGSLGPTDLQADDVQGDLIPNELQKFRNILFRPRLTVIITLEGWH
jgi:hypothetical protein